MGDQLTPGAELARRVTVLAAELGMVAIVARATLRARDDALQASQAQCDDEWRMLGLWIAIMVIVTPTAWEHYLVLMLIPFLLIVDAASRGAASSRTVWAVIAAWMMWPIQSLFGVVLIPLIPLHFRLVPVLALAQVGMVAQAFGFLAAYWFVTDRVCEVVRAPGAYAQSPCARAN